MADREAKNKYAYLDQLTTEELQELLRVDIDSPVSSDDEAIFYILGVIEKRECAVPSVSFPDLGKSWKEFSIILAYHFHQQKIHIFYNCSEEIPI